MVSRSVENRSADRPSTGPVRERAVISMCQRRSGPRYTHGSRHASSGQDDVPRRSYHRASAATAKSSRLCQVNRSVEVASAMVWVLPVSSQTEPV